MSAGATVSTVNAWVSIIESDIVTRHNALFHSEIKLVMNTDVTNKQSLCEQYRIDLDIEVKL